MREDRLHRVGHHLEDVGLLEPADQREQGDVEEHRAPIELLHDLLEARRFLQPVAENLEDQHQDDRAGHRDEAELDAEHLAERHRQHGQQEHADGDDGEQRIGNVGLDAGGAFRRHLADAAEAVEVHERRAS